MRSVRYANLLAGGYTLLAVVYIIVSSAVAARIAVDLEDLRRIETLKGVLYVVVTAVAIWLGAWALLRKLESSEQSLRARDQALIANERRVFAGLLAASVAHDANNVLVGVLADIDGLREIVGPQETRVARLQVGVDRLIALNRRLMNTVRQSRSTQMEAMDLTHEVREMVGSMKSLTPIRGCAVNVDGMLGIKALCQRPLLQPIISNLLLNAAEAVSGHGKVEVRIVQEPQSAVLEVHDSGPGIASDRWPGLFDALESTKSDGNGLGLFSVKTCVGALGGHVEVAKSPLGGACFRVTLPRA